MFAPPSIGDRFAHPTTDHPIGTVERVTKADGTIWLWCDGTSYPWQQCEPIGIWQALALAFVADLDDCTSYQQVTDLLAGLSDADRVTIWAACTPDLKEKIRRLKAEAPLQALNNKLAAVRFHQDVDALLESLSAEEKTAFDSLPWEVRGRLAMLPDRPRPRHQLIPPATTTRQSPTRQNNERKATAIA
jgi:hypothetical protein